MFIKNCRNAGRFRSANAQQGVELVQGVFHFLNTYPALSQVKDEMLRLWCSFTVRVTHPSALGPARLWAALPGILSDLKPQAGPRPGRFRCQSAQFEAGSSRAAKAGPGLARALPVQETRRCPRLRPGRRGRGIGCCQRPAHHLFPPAGTSPGGVQQCVLGG